MRIIIERAEDGTLNVIGKHHWQEGLPVRVVKGVTRETRVAAIKAVVDGMHSDREAKRQALLAATE